MRHRIRCLFSWYWWIIFFLRICCLCSSLLIYCFSTQLWRKFVQFSLKKVVLEIKTSSYSRKKSKWASKSRKLKPRTSRKPLKSTLTRNIRKYLNLHSFCFAPLYVEWVVRWKKINGVEIRHLNAWTKTLQRYHHQKCLLHFGCVSILYFIDIINQQYKINQQEI